MAICLPSDPKESTYEDLVTACLIGLGFFVEANLHLRDGTSEILELDVVATPVSEPVKNTILFDAKSGKPGASDLFKMYGWRTYLKIPKACIVRPGSPDLAKQQSLTKLAQQTQVHFVTVNLEDFDLSCFPSKSFDLPEEYRDLVIGNAWYGRMGKRICMKEFNIAAKQSDIQTWQLAKSYRWAIEQSFFEPDPLHRVGSIYSAYKASPKISGRLISELASSNSLSPSEIWNKVSDTSEYPAVQFCLMIENTARLRILKNCLMHVNREQTTKSNKWESISRFIQEQSMPKSFVQGLKTIESYEFKNNIPFFWQFFIEVFGGFYNKTNPAEIEILSICTGVPAQHIPFCLSLYEKFFPMPKGWFFTVKDEIEVMKHIPAIYRGTGAFLRKSLFDAHMQAMYKKTDWLLSKWHNALYDILKPELRADENN